MLHGMPQNAQKMSSVMTGHKGDPEISRRSA
jgi:hypothetical protein